MYIYIYIHISIYIYIYLYIFIHIVGKFLDLWYRVEKNNSVSLKVRGKLPCPLYQVLSIFNETDLFGNWAPLFKQGERLHSMSRSSQLVRQVYDYPILGTKESILFCFAINALDECGSVMIFGPLSA